MRHERSAQASGVEQMFFEGKRNWYRVYDRETGKVVASSESSGDLSGSYAEVTGEAVITHPSGNPERTGSAHSLKNVRVEGDIKTNNN